jgi:hypothetical protein
MRVKAVRTYEVWIASFPGFHQRRQVSDNGGSVPRWRKDGRELFYLALDGKMMAVDVTPGSTISKGRPLP